MKKIKWGIIGPGIIAKQFANDIQFCEHAELVAVASRNIERAGSLAKEYNISKTYGSYEELYADPEIDAVYVATPHNFHFQQSADALKAGKAVLCEKPLTVTPQETYDLIDIAKSTKQYLMEGMWTYFLPAVRKAKEWADQGRIGEIKHINVDFGYPKTFEASSRLFNPDLAGGVLLDMGVYCVAMAWLFSQEDPLNISTIARKAPSGTDNDVSILFEYKRSAARLYTSFEAKLPNWAYIIGTDGYIAIPDFWRAHECYLYKMDELIAHFIDPRKGQGFEFQIDAMSHDLLNGKKESEIMPHSNSMKLQEHMAGVMERF